MDWRLLLLWICSTLVEKISANLPPPCDSEIYCKAGDTSLLHIVQMKRLYKDSKTFVDKAIKTTPNEVLNNFRELMQVNTINSLRN